MSFSFERVQEIIEEVLFLPKHAWEDHIASVCGQDRALRREIESLLQHAEVPDDGFLRPPSGAEERAAQRDQSLVGRQVGAYQICEVVASGGMGTVYVAQQQQPWRKVAIKMMRGWSCSEAARRRFDFETTALARLTHPNIARIYEAGTHEDIPYFAMEYVVDAASITTYADKNGLDTTRRLGLMLDVCEAVQHAHQKGVIHRDLKPSNILIDGEGYVKIIDFGVARSTASDVTSRAAHTSAGQLLGTLQYMSPEQCSADVSGLDVRSDVFSLGVLMYELICRELPYDVSNATVAHAARMICEQDPQPPALSRARVRGDLGLVLLKAIEKDRERRYQSASDLARDVRCYLSNEPVEAKPPTAWTHVSRFMVRRPFLATTIACLMIVVCTITATMMSVAHVHLRPHRIEREADGQWARLIAMNGNIIKEWRASEFGEVHMAELIQRPPVLGGGRIAALGFGVHGNNSMSKKLCVFTEDSEFDRIEWEGQLANGDIPRSAYDGRGFRRSDFFLSTGRVLNIFPNSPGPELVAVHKHHQLTHSAIRIYDLTGRVLYQAWLNGQINSMHWMNDANLLIIAGLNGRALWPERDHPEVKPNDRHPCVVFAIRPQLGYIATDYLGETCGSPPARPVWYKALLPPELTVDVRLEVASPMGRYDLGHSAELSIIFKNINRGFALVLDEDGQMIAGSSVLHNQYQVAGGDLPSPDAFTLGPLPSVINDDRRAIGSGRTSD